MLRIVSGPKSAAAIPLLLLAIMPFVAPPQAHAGVATEIGLSPGDSGSAAITETAPADCTPGVHGRKCEPKGRKTTPPTATSAPATPTWTSIPSNTPRNTATATASATSTATATPPSVCASKTDGMTCDAGTDGAQTLICVAGACVTCTADAGAAPRFVDNQDGTITDRTTCLVWEKKDINSAGLHSVHASYRWAGYCSNNTGKNCQPNAAASSACGAAFGCAQCEASEGFCDGAFVNQTVFEWLTLINTNRFAGHADWRLPKEEGRSGAGGANELETILAEPYLCDVGPPCVDAPFSTNCGTDNNNFGCTIDGAGGTSPCSCSGSSNYWSGTASGGSAWLVIFSSGYPGTANQLYNFQARAVRGGL